MSKFEAELRLPCKQPYAYINVVVRGDDKAEFTDNVNALSLSLVENLTDFHSQAYDVVMGVKPAPSAQALIESELGGKVIDQTHDQVMAGKPWERPKPSNLAPDVKTALSNALDDF